MKPFDGNGEVPLMSKAEIRRQALTVGGEVGCITILIVLGAVFGGLWLDQQFGTKPILTILLVLGSAPFSLFLTYRLAKRVVEGNNRSTLSSGEPKPKEGETTGE